MTIRTKPNTLRRNFAGLQTHGRPNANAIFGAHVRIEANPIPRAWQEVRYLAWSANSYTRLHKGDS